MYHGPITIKHYKISIGQNMLIVASHHGPVENAKATIALEGQNGHDINIHFIADGEDLPDPYFSDYGKSGGMYLHYCQLPHIVDMLRNERPIYGHLYVAHDGNGRLWISTDAEPIGEGEEK
jgi:hypothetical protein